MRTFCLVAVMAAAVVAAFATSASAQALKVVSEADLFLQGHHRFIVHSNRIGRDFAVTVTMPVAYSVYGPPATKVAAIYALDNGYDVAGPIAQMLSRTGVLSPAYVISVGYVEGQPNMRAKDDEYLDLTEGEGGVAFQKFLTSELRPFIEARYPLDPAKAILFGHSLGGVFAANVLAQTPKAFSGYIIGSPSVQTDGSVIERLAGAAPKAVGVSVFLAVGDAEPRFMIDGAKQVEAALSVKGSVVNLKSHVYAGEGHINYYPQLTSEAFEWLLPALPSRAPASLPEEAFARIAGTYKTDDGRVIKITRYPDGPGKTVIAALGVPGQTELTAETPQRFYLKGLDLPVTFEGAIDKPAVAVLLGGVPKRAVRQK
jgi:predicted alpha/beta superfamily hydrolase